MRAKDVMTTDVATVGPDSLVADAARLMLSRRISALPVIDLKGALVGIVSEGDLLRRSETDTERRRSWWLELLASNAERSRDFEKSHGRHIRNVMTRPAVSVTEDTPIAEIADILESHGIKRVPVLRDGRLVGIVSRANLLQALAVQSPAPSTISTEDRVLREAVVAELARQKWVSVAPADVVVEKGVVHLWGHSLTHEERAAMTVAAENVPGVREVLNHMVVVPMASFQPI